MARPRFRSASPDSFVIELCRKTLDEGFAFLEKPSNDRRIDGHRIAPPKGLALFRREHGATTATMGLRCQCGRTATHFAATRHSNDKVSPFVMNLFAGTVLLTQDHIVPKSLDGSNHVDNMRVMCSPCNGKRGNRLVIADLIHGALFPRAVATPTQVARSMSDLLNDARHGWQPQAEPSMVRAG